MRVRKPFIVIAFVFFSVVLACFSWEGFHDWRYGGESEQVSAATGMAIIGRRACEAYYAQQGHLPPASKDHRLTEDILEPVNYVGERGGITGLPIDPFDRSGSPLYTTTISWGRLARDKASIHVKGMPVRYYVFSPMSFLVAGNGPDKDIDLSYEMLSKGPVDWQNMEALYAYDPTNGIQSGGDILEFGSVDPVP
jgi:hypothetical protein